jgi:prepilin signal peptidase PulO-like enzyme (type II secretory pathway)
MSLLIITASSIAIALIDWRHHIIPDELQLALFLGVVVYQFFTGNLQVSLVGHALIVALPILLLYLPARAIPMYLFGFLQ